MDNDNFVLTTPVVFITFNRLDTAQEVFEQIKKAAPRKLYLISDGARQNRQGEAKKAAEVRGYIEAGIDWDCEVHRIYADSNMGCRGRIASGLDEVFEHEDTAIIIEDDIKPHNTFFRYCQTMLEWYKDDERIGMITGCNLCPDYDCGRDYIFSKITEIWGWATWRRVWKNYRISITDEEMKELADTRYLRNYWGRWYGDTIMKGLIDVKLERCSAWSYSLSYLIATNNQLVIVPGHNLITNIGFEREDATNTAGKSRYVFPEGELEFPIARRSGCSVDYEYDKQYVDAYHKENPVQFVYSFVVSHYLDWKKDRQRRKKGCQK